MIIDTHCHLDFDVFDKDRDEVIQRAVSSGVRNIVNVGSSLQGSVDSVALANQYDFIYASIGIHPYDAKKEIFGDIEKIEKLAKHPKVVAIGEVGLDFHRNISDKTTQYKTFIEFIRLTKKNNLPIIIHNREASEDTMAILKEQFDGYVCGVMHCYSQGKEFLRKCLDIGLYVSFTANITFKNADAIREVIKYVPLDRILVETDAPFLCPQDYRGERNEPAYVKYVIDTIANIKDEEHKKIEEITTENALKLFDKIKI